MSRLGMRQVQREQLYKTIGWIVNVMSRRSSRELDMFACWKRRVVLGQGVWHEGATGKFHALGVSVATAACGKLTVESTLMEIFGIPRKLSSV